MKKTPLSVPLLLILLISTFLVIGCEGEVSFTTANLSEAKMALGVTDANKPFEPTNTFTVDTAEIFCSVKLSNAPADTEIKSTWIYIEGEAADLTDYEIDSYALVAEGTQYLQFSMARPDAGWPRGDYKLVLEIAGYDKEATELLFTVE